MKTRISLIEDVCALCDLSFSEKSLLFTLARYANPDGTSVYPSQGLLAKLLKTTDRTIRTLLASLKNKGYLGEDGMRKHCKQYRLYIPDRITGAVPGRSNLSTPDIPQEEWEAQFLTDEELQEQGLLEDQAQTLGGELEENQGLQLPPPPDELEDDEPTEPMPALVAQARPPETPPPIIGRLPTVLEQTWPPIVVDSRPPVTPEKFQRDIEVMRVAANLVLTGKMKLDIYMHRGRSKGFSEELLNAMLGRGQEKTDSPLFTDQVDGESAPLTTPYYQRQAYINHEDMQA